MRLLRERDIIQLKVVDDGQGFDPGGDGSDGSVDLGILGMRERLRPWCGTLTVEIGPQGGTIVLAAVRDDGEKLVPD